MLKARKLEAHHGSARVLEPTDLQVECGTCVCIIGPNGAGKTTLLNALCGIGPTSGERALAGRSLARGVSASVAYAESDPVLVGTMTVADAVRFDLSMRGMRLTDSEIEKALALFRCLPFSDTRVDACSLGMRRRAALSTAWAGQPDLLLLDEPGNGLDTEGLLCLADALASARRAGRIVILSSHDLAFAQRHCDRALMIEQGRIVADASTEACDLEAEFRRRFIKVSTTGGTRD